MILDYYDRSVELETYLEEKDKTHLLKNISLPNVHIHMYGSNMRAVRGCYPAG
jgi:UTP-glucose-1-phosphate uridylyltransferase